MENLYEGVVTTIAVILIFGLPFFVIYLGIFSLKTKHKENMELIKQGIIPPSKSEKPTPNKYRSLRNGIICIGIALGIIVNIVLKYTLDISGTDNILFLGGSILLFMGLAYVIYYLIIKNKKELNNEQEYE